MEIYGAESQMSRPDPILFLLFHAHIKFVQEEQEGYSFPDEENKEASDTPQPEAVKTPQQRQADRGSDVGEGIYDGDGHQGADEKEAESQAPQKRASRTAQKV